METDEAKTCLGEANSLVSFPERLQQIIECEEYSDAIRWSPKGDMFHISIGHFKKYVLEKHFGGTKFESFTRKLNRWGFRRVRDSKVAAHGIMLYRHEHFQKDKPELIKKMKISHKEDNQFKDIRMAAYYDRMTNPSLTSALDTTSLLQKIAAESTGGINASRSSIAPSILVSGGHEALPRLSLDRGALELLHLQQQQEATRLKLLELEQLRTDSKILLSNAAMLQRQRSGLTSMALTQQVLGAATSFFDPPHGSLDHRLLQHLQTKHVFGHNFPFRF